MEENVTTIEAPKKRSTFLTVLCILSFIGSGGGLLYSVYQYATFESTYPAQMEKLTTALEQLEDAGIDSGFMYKSAENGIITLEKMSQNLELVSGSQCLALLLSLIGVFLMFKMKKNGFYLYTLVNYFGLLVPLVLIDFDAALTNVMIGGVITTIFVIMYAVNLKQME